jgi:hypothetical protein
VVTGSAFLPKSEVSPPVNDDPMPAAAVAGTAAGSTEIGEIN